MVTKFLNFLKSLFKIKKTESKTESKKTMDIDIVIDIYRPTQTNPYSKCNKSNYVGVDSVEKIVNVKPEEKEEKTSEEIDLTISNVVNATKCKSFNIKKNEQSKSNSKYEVFDVVENKSLGGFPSLFKVAKRLSVSSKTISRHLQNKYSSKRDNKKNLDEVLFKQKYRITKLK